jgi:hypothetical protein
MDDVKLISIGVGVVGALVGVYFRECFRRAVRQKLLASKLEAQVHDILTGLLATNFCEILAVAEVWRKESGGALRAKGSEMRREVERKWETRLKEIKAKIKDGDKELDETLMRQREAYRKMPERLFSYHIQQFELARDSLFSSKAFLSEDEAAEISWDTVARVVSFRTALARLIHYNIAFALGLREMEEPNLEGIRQISSEYLEESIRLSQHLIPLRDKGMAIRTKSLTRLTFENMLGKP